MATERKSSGEVAKWMRDEHQALVDLNKVLRQHIAARPEVNVADWLRGLQAGFGRLRAHLERHFAVQEEGGYLSMVVERRPTLSTHVEHIRREHDELLQMAEHILRDSSEVMPENRLLLADLCARVQRFMAVVADHDQRENMITLLVFSQDIGGKD